MPPRKTLKKALANPKNIRFEEFASLVEAYGFRQSRTSGSHHIYSRVGIPEFLNIQNVHGEAKPYQVRQFLKIVERYNLRLPE